MAWRRSLIPATAVYLVKLFWMASMPACLMCSGVAKWGSPAPKSTRSTPCERRVVASLLMAMVAEISMRPMRAVNAVAPAVDDTDIPFGLLIRIAPRHVLRRAAESIWKPAGRRLGAAREGAHPRRLG